jgi:hypothetical protein
MRNETVQNYLKFEYLGDFKTKIGSILGGLVRSPDESVVQISFDQKTSFKRTLKKRKILSGGGLSDRNTYVPVHVEYLKKNVGNHEEKTICIN